MRWGGRVKKQVINQAMNQAIHQTANQQIKASLRKQLLRDRRALPADQWQLKSQQLCQHLAQWERFQQAQSILAFFSFRQEPDLSPLWSAFPAKTWVFPRCVGQDLVWHSVAIAQQDTQTQTGAYGILEPRPNQPIFEEPCADLILMPCVACDRQGYRLGYGAGFYDRWLAGGDRGHTVGILFAEALIDPFPHDAWDLPLQSLCHDQALRSLCQENV